jgi:hypothetical protein
MLISLIYWNENYDKFCKPNETETTAKNRSIYRGKQTNLGVKKLTKLDNYVTGK